MIQPTGSTLPMRLQFLLIAIAIYVLLPQGATAFFAQQPAPGNKGKSQIPSNYKVLILPGFGNDSADYTAPSEKCLIQSLEQKGWSQEQIDVLPVERSDWLQVFTNGIFDLKFWQSDAPPTRPAFRWYLDRVATHIDEHVGPDEKVLLLGHSAGGWLGRAAVGYGNQMSGEAEPVDLDKVAGFVTLGAPHLPPPEGVMDMTRGALRLTNEEFPGCYHAPSAFYITVCGLAIRGEEQQRKAPWEPTTVKGFAYNSYEGVCGNGTAIGDGVVPLPSAHLEGAEQIDLEGVLHSINSPDNWYGSIDIIDQWHDEMLSQVASQIRPKRPTLKFF